MTCFYQACRQTLKSAFSLGAALLIIVNTSAWAQPIKDVKKWLKEFKGQLGQTNTATAFVPTKTFDFNLPNNIVIQSNGQEPTLYVEHSSNDDNFSIKYRKIVRANRERIRRMLNNAVEVNLLNRKSDVRRHRIYINTVKQNIVSKNRIGRLKFNIVVAHNRSHFNVNYTFR